jgi:hypothetical protein
MYRNCNFYMLRFISETNPSGDSLFIYCVGHIFYSLYQLSKVHRNRELCLSISEYEHDTLINAVSVLVKNAVSQVILIHTHCVFTYSNQAGNSYLFGSRMTIQYLCNESMMYRRLPSILCLRIANLGFERPTIRLLQYLICHIDAML